MGASACQACVRRDSPELCTPRKKTPGPTPRIIELDLSPPCVSATPSPEKREECDVHGGCLQASKAQQEQPEVTLPATCFLERDLHARSKDVPRLASDEESSQNQDRSRASADEESTVQCEALGNNQDTSHDLSAKKSTVQIEALQFSKAKSSTEGGAPTSGGQTLMSLARYVFGHSLLCFAGCLEHIATLIEAAPKTLPRNQAENGESTRGQRSVSDSFPPLETATSTELRVAVDAAELGGRVVEDPVASKEATDCPMFRIKLTEFGINFRSVETQTDEQVVDKATPGAPQAAVKFARAEQSAATAHPWTPHPCTFGGAMQLADNMHGANLFFATGSQLQPTARTEVSRMPPVDTSGSCRRKLCAAAEYAVESLQCRIRVALDKAYASEELARALLPSVCASPCDESQQSLQPDAQANSPALTDWLRGLASFSETDTARLGKGQAGAQGLLARRRSSLMKMRQFPRHVEEADKLEQARDSSTPDVSLVNTCLRPESGTEHCQKMLMSSSREGCAFAKLPSVATWLRPKSSEEECRDGEHIFDYEALALENLPAAREYTWSAPSKQIWQLVSKFPSAATWIRPRFGLEQHQHDVPQFSSYAGRPSAEESECVQQLPRHEVRPVSKLPSVATWLKQRSGEEESEHKQQFFQCESATCTLPAPGPRSVAEECQHMLQLSSCEVRRVGKLPSVATWLRPTFGRQELVEIATRVKSGADKQKPTKPSSSCEVSLVSKLTQEDALSAKIVSQESLQRSSVPRAPYPFPFSEKA